MSTNEALTVDALLSMMSFDAASGVFIWLCNRHNSIRSGAEAGYSLRSGRVFIRINGTRYARAHLAWLATHGTLPRFEIDHMDGDPSNDRPSNLRDVSHKANLENRRRPNSRVGGRSSAYLGVSWKKDKQKWVANISSNRKALHLGYFDTEHAAHAAYLRAKRELHEGNTL